MIITRSPLRITLGGGGTDLPSYYREHGGFLIAAAIDKYVFVTVMRPFIEGIFLKYSKLEHVGMPDEVQHPIIREAIKMLGFRTPQVEITTLADIPAGTGLGSSGSFTTALLKALHAHRRRLIHPQELAELACDVEINRLGRAHRQAGPVHRGLRGRDLLHVQPRRDRRGAAARHPRCVAARPRGQPAVVLHGLLAQRERDPEGPESPHRAVRRGDAGEPALRQGTRAAQPAGARAGRHRTLRGADARALGPQDAGAREA